MSRIQHIKRNIYIIQAIRNKPYLPFNEIKEFVERMFTNEKLPNVAISDRTIQRDLNDIRTDFVIDIKYDKKQDGYYIEENGYESILENFWDSYEKFNALSGKPDIFNYVEPERHTPTGSNHLSALISAIKHSRQIIFSYLKFGETKESYRQLEPYLLKEFRGRWYLIGRTAGKGNLKIFGLDRIQELEISEDTFQRDESLNLSELFKHSFGIYSSENYPVEEVILSFSKIDGNYLKSLPLHHSQEILKDADDEFIVRLKLCITYDFIMEIISRSWSLKVLAPQSLRERITEIWQSAIERNKSAY